MEVSRGEVVEWEQVMSWERGELERLRDWEVEGLRG